MELIVHCNYIDILTAVYGYIRAAICVGIGSCALVSNPSAIAATVSIAGHKGTAINYNVQINVRGRAFSVEVSYNGIIRVEIAAVDRCQCSAADIGYINNC